MYADLSKLTCLVLGAGGFLGRNLCQLLIDYKVNVIGFDKAQCPADFNGRIKWVSGDFTCLDDYSELVRQSDVIFHLVATTVPGTSNDQILFDIDTNLKATIQLLEFTRKLIGKKVIYASSGGAVYGLAGDVKATERCPTNPISSYGIVKLACEKYLALFEHLYNLQYTVFRIANPFGPYQYGFKAQGAVAAFVQRSLTGQPIDIWGDGEVVRDYVYIKDVASALLSCCFYNGDRKMFNIGSGTGRSLNSLIQDIFRQTGKSVPVRYHERRKADVPHIVLDCTLAKKELSYSPAFSFEHGLQETIRWISQNLHG